MCLERLFTRKTVFYSYARVSQRYVFAVLGFLGMVAAFSMRSCFNIAITQMVRPTLLQAPPSSPIGNLTSEKPHHRLKLALYSGGNPTTLTSNNDYFDWDEETQGAILASFYYGYVITHIPGSALIQRFGGKQVLGIGILITAVLTLLTPWAAHKGVYPLMALRFCEGVGEGAKFPAVSHLVAQWAPPLERSKLTTFVFSGALIGLLVGTSLGGIIIGATENWQDVFYVFGFFGIAWYILWLFLGYDDPLSHPFISDEEKQYLQDTIGQLERKKTLGSTPWREMMKSGPLWSLIIAEFGHDWAVYIILSDLPKYMNDVLHFSVAQNGMLSSLPSLTSWVVSIVAGYLADWILAKKLMSITALRKLFSTIGSFGSAIAILIVSYAGCNRVLVVAMITVGLGLMGFCIPSLKVNTIDLSPNYSATIMALCNGIGCFGGIFAPYTAGLLTPNRTLEEWQMVFWIMAVLLVSSNCVFLLFGSAEVQYWNDVSESDAKTRGKREKTEPHSHSDC